MMTINLLINSITIGIGLAMDAFSVSLANGLYYPKMNFSKRIEIALTFAVFQFIMPLTGWLCVHTILDLFKSLQKFIPWIAFILLSFIGFKMILEGLNNTESVKEESLNFKTLFIQGVATSIDALSVGFTIANVALLEALLESIIIGVVTFIICILGLFIGNKVGSRFHNNAIIFGGFILVFIGVRILFGSF